MVKDGGIYRNCLLEKTRIPPSILHIQPDNVYFFIHALLTFRIAILCTVYKMFDKESVMSVDDVSLIVETSSMMSIESVESVETSSMMSIEFTITVVKKRKRNIVLRDVLSLLNLVLY